MRSVKSPSGDFKPLWPQDKEKVFIRQKVNKTKTEWY